MRLRYKSWAPNYLKKSKWVINNPRKYKRKWEKVFKNSNPINLEIGIGKGQFINKQSLENVNYNYLGLEKSESINVIPIKKINKDYKPRERRNIRYLSEDACNLNSFFENESIHTIFINFPDPWPKKRHGKRRLVHKIFLSKYFDILTNGGSVEFKTDQKFLYEFALEELREYKNFIIINQSQNLHSDQKNIVTTEYEDKFCSFNQPIYFIKFIK